MLKPTAKNVNHNVKAKPSVSIVWLIQLAIIATISGRLGNLEDQKQYCQTITTTLISVASDQLFVDAKRSSSKFPRKPFTTNQRPDSNKTPCNVLLLNVT